MLPSSPSFSHASGGTPHTQSLTDQADFTSKIHPEFDCFSPPSLGTAWSTPPSWLTGRIAVIHSGYILCSGHTGQTVTGSPRSPAVKWENRGNVLHWARPHAHFPHSSPVGRESTCNAGDPGSIPGLGRSPGERNGNPLQYSCLGNPMDRGALQAIVSGVARVRHDLATKPQPQPPCSLHTTVSSSREEGEDE